MASIDLWLERCCYRSSPPVAPHPPGAVVVVSSTDRDQGEGLSLAMVVGVGRKGKEDMWDMSCE